MSEMALGYPSLVFDFAATLPPPHVLTKKICEATPELEHARAMINSDAGDVARSIGSTRDMLDQTRIGLVACTRLFGGYPNRHNRHSGFVVREGDQQLSVAHLRAVGSGVHTDAVNCLLTSADRKNFLHLALSSRGDRSVRAAWDGEAVQVALHEVGDKMESSSYYDRQTAIYGAQQMAQVILLSLSREPWDVLPAANVAQYAPRQS